MTDDVFRDHQSKAGRSRSRKKLAALAKSQPAAAAARRGRPATIGVKKLLRYAEWIASDYPNIAADLRQIAAGQDGDEPWNVEVKK